MTDKVVSILKLAFLDRDTAKLMVIRCLYILGVIIVNQIKKTAKEVASEVVAILGSTAIMSLMLWVVIAVK